MGSRISSLPGADEFFVVASACSPLQEMGGTVMMVSSAKNPLADIDSALDPGVLSSRTVLARIGEGFMRMSTAIMRLQDEGIAHAGICAHAAAFDTKRDLFLLADFSRALPMVELSEESRRIRYPPPDLRARHLPPEYHLVSSLVHSDTHIVGDSDIADVCREFPAAREYLSRVVGLNRCDAIAALEDTWQSWDMYSLAHLFAERLRAATAGTDISLNTWLCGVLSVWENCCASEPTIRPPFQQVRRLFDKAWFRSGSIEDCQRAVDAVDGSRLRAVVSLPFVECD